jgi:hypothetical protein
MSESEEMRGEQREVSGRDVAMDEFEQALTRAMRRVEVRPEMTARLLAIATQAPEHQRRARRLWFMPARSAAGKTGGKVLVLPHPRAWMGGVLAAMLVLGVFAGEQAHARHERAEAAQQQFETSVRITDRALDQAREQLARAGVLQDE